MKLYKYTFGEWELYGPAIDDADADKRKTDVDPQFHYVPVTIEEVKLEGYEIEVTPILQFGVVKIPITKEMVQTMDKDGLKQCLKSNNIEFHHTLGEDKLRELVIQHI